MAGLVMTGFLLDVRLALRQLRRNPGFTITATAMLAVAICANSTVSSWIDGTMLHPIPGAQDTGGLVSVILAATGIYGVVAYRTQLRTHEIGVRMALGASRVDVLRQGFSLTMVGLGLALSFGLMRFIAGLLYGISSSDPVTVVAVVVLLGAISLLACYLPARRAMRANPVAAIREL